MTAIAMRRAQKARALGAFCFSGTAAGDGSSAMMAEQFKGYVMKKLMTAAVALMVFGAGPALAASSSSSGGSRSGATGLQTNPGMRSGTSGTGAGVTAPNTGPGAVQSNRTPYAPTAPPVPGSAQDPYGNSASGNSTGTGGSATNPSPTSPGSTR